MGAYARLTLAGGLWVPAAFLATAGCCHVLRRSADDWERHPARGSFSRERDGTRAGETHCGRKLRRFGRLCGFSAGGAGRVSVCSRHLAVVACGDSADPRSGNLGCAATGGAWRGRPDDVFRSTTCPAQHLVPWPGPTNRKTTPATRYRRRIHTTSPTGISAPAHTPRLFRDGGARLGFSIALSAPARALGFQGYPLPTTALSWCRCELTRYANSQSLHRIGRNCGVRLQRGGAGRLFPPLSRVELAIRYLSPGTRTRLGPRGATPRPCSCPRTSLAIRPPPPRPRPEGGGGDRGADVSTVFRDSTAWEGGSLETSDDGSTTLERPFEPPRRASFGSPWFTIVRDGGVLTFDTEGSRGWGEQFFEQTCVVSPVDQETDYGTATTTIDVAGIGVARAVL